MLSIVSCTNFKEYSHHTKALEDGATYQQISQYAASQIKQSENDNTSDPMKIIDFLSAIRLNADNEIAVYPELHSMSAIVEELNSQLIPAENKLPPIILKLLSGLVKYEIELEQMNANNREGIDLQSQIKVISQKIADTQGDEEEHLHLLSFLQTQLSNIIVDTNVESLTKKETNMFQHLNWRTIFSNSRV